MTRPDYCPVAQEPCQAMCALSDVRCQIRDTAPQPQPDEHVDCPRCGHCCPDDTALLRQALEALEELQYANTDKAERMAAEAIAALRERLKS